MFDLLKLIIPPGDPLGKWRMIMAAAVAISMVHIVLAKGLVPGFDGYALSAEASANASQLQSITEILLEQSIASARREQCRALASGNGQARQLAEANLRRYLARYDKETGRQYPLLDCGPS